MASKFAQNRRDLEFDGVYHAFRALGRLLLAEPDDELVGIRERILRRPERGSEVRGGARVRDAVGRPTRGIR